MRLFGKQEEVGETEPPGESARRRAEGHDNADVERLAMRQLLLYVILPLWMGPGLIDYLWHCKTKIEETGGTFESLTHAAMMTLAGIPVTLALFCEINALVLSTMAGAWVVHEGVAFLDVWYAKELREVSVGEQQTHSFLEVFPLTAMVLIAAMNWKQVLSLAGVGEKPRWQLEWKRPPLTKRYVAGILGAIGAFVALPYGEELVRCYRHDHTLLPHRPKKD